MRKRKVWHCVLITILFVLLSMTMLRFLSPTSVAGPVDPTDLPTEELIINPITDSPINPPTDQPTASSTDASTEIPTEPPHVHDFELKEQKDPTCAVDGLIKYECVCGEIKEEVLPATGQHNFIIEKRIEPTCGENGQLIFKCNCGEQKIEILPKTEQHHFAAVETMEPTCALDGKIIFQCECGQSYVEILNKTNEHVFVEISRQESTCYQNGWVKYQCKCGETKDEVLALSTTHNFKEIERVAPTCAKNGLIRYACQCGLQKEEKLTKTSEHNWVEISYQEPTVTSTGLKTFECSVCHKQKTETVPKIVQKIDLRQKQSRTLIDSLPSDLKTIAYQILDQYYEVIKEKGTDSREAILVQPSKELTDMEEAQLAYAFVYDSGVDNSVINFFHIYYWPQLEQGTMASAGGSTTWVSRDDCNENGVVFVVIGELTRVLEARDQNVQKCKEIVQSLNDGTDLEIVKQIFAYADKYFSYDASVAWLSNLFDTKKGSCNAQSTFINVCCNLCGIQSDIIVGYTDDGRYHAWSRIIIDGQQTFWDATRSRYRNCTSLPYHAKLINCLSNNIDQYPDIVF